MSGLDVCCIFIDNKAAWYSLYFARVPPHHPIVYQSDDIEKKVIANALVGSCFLSVLSGASSLSKPLSYYNELIGQEHGWKVFADSNTDWGQDVDVVQQYVKEKQITNATLRVLTMQDLKYYGIALPRTGNTCSAGMHIASAYQVYITGATWLANYTPVKQLGTSVFVFNVSESSCKEQRD